MLLKKLRMLFVIALIAIFAVACSPNAGTDQGENPGTGTEEPGTDPSDPDTPENPGTDIPEDLSKGQNLVLKVNDNWELIHKMEVE